MSKFQKLYVGKGHEPSAGYDITRITLKMDELKKLVYQLDGVDLVTVEVAKMKEADDYKRTHTVYGQIKEEVIFPVKEKYQRKPKAKAKKPEKAEA